MRKISVIALAVIIAVLAATAAFAAEPMEVKTDKVIVFKDGYSMFIKRAEGTIGADGVALVSGVPNGALGTVWCLPDKLTLKNMTARTTLDIGNDEKVQHNHLALDFGKGAAGMKENLTLTHYGPGLSWIPTYRIALKSNSVATLQMQAEVINSGVELEETDLDLVVGVPNFRFRDHTSPLCLAASAMTRGVTSNIPGFANQRSQQMMNNFQFDGSVDMPMSLTPNASPALSGGLTAHSSQDLFVYNIKDADLASGERAAFPLLTADVNYRHVYTWETRRKRRSSGQQYSAKGQSMSPVNLERNEIWHQIELTNDSGLPWSTGPAITMEGYLPLGQEMLGYTPRGGKTMLPLTIAVDVLGKASEEETGRKTQALKVGSSYYTRIDCKGALEVTNYKAEPIELTIKYEFGGFATEISGGGEYSIGEYSQADWETNNYTRQNGHSTLSWELKLKPGEKKEVEYQYYYYGG